MKPIIIIRVSNDDDHKKMDEQLIEVKSKGVLIDYEVIVIHGDISISIFYPPTISYYFNKIKTWLIHKTQKNK